MKCEKGNQNCTLELEFKKNGDVIEFCTVCDYKNIYRNEDILNNHLNPYIEKN